MGVLGVLWGSREVRGRPGKGWGRFREGPGGSLKNVIFTVLEVNLSMV